MDAMHARWRTEPVCLAFEFEVEPDWPQHEYGENGERAGE
ncbi:MAG: hypothetical protein QOG90_1495 [Actinomycetota bacterium]|jgi:hypothetical protein